VRKLVLATLAGALLLSGCGPSKSEYRALEAEKEALSQTHERLSWSLEQVVRENDALHTELERLTSGPQKLYGDLLAAMEVRDYERAYHTGKRLLEEFEDTTEAIRARNSVAHAQEVLQNRALEAKSHLRARHDYATATTWYTHRQSDEQLLHTPLYLYIGQRGESLFLRMRIQRTVEGNARWKAYEIKTPTESFHLPLEANQTRAQPVHGGQWQWHDMSVTAQQRRMIDALVRSQKGRVAFFGDEAREVALTAADIRHIAQMVESYEALKAYPLEP
jgi:hypothetical protein